MFSPVSSPFRRQATNQKGLQQSLPSLLYFDTADAQKNGFGLNGYVVNIGYDRARELHGKKIRITGKVTFVKGLKNQPRPGYRAGWQDDIKYIQSPKIGIIES